MTRRSRRREPPAVLVEWQQACQAYVDAREAGQVTEAIRARTRETWLGDQGDRWLGA